MFIRVRDPAWLARSVERLVAGEPRSFYHLVVLDDSGGELFVPVDKVQAIGIRLLVERSDIPKLLGPVDGDNQNSQGLEAARQ